MDNDYTHHCLLLYYRYSEFNFFIYLYFHVCKYIPQNGIVTIVYFAVLDTSPKMFFIGLGLFVYLVQFRKRD